MDLDQGQHMVMPPFRNIKQRFGLRDTDRILDIGGAGAQISEVQVHTLVDIAHPSYYSEIHPPGHRPDPELTAKEFVRLDVCRDPLPFSDKSFDFCTCWHTLEDLYDPRLVLFEMGRVAKRGFIVTPSRGREMVFASLDITDWLTGGVRVPGHAHHHWFVEQQGNTLVITPKHYPLLYCPEFHVTRWLGQEECEYYWEGAPSARFWESINFRDLLADYRAFVAANRHLIRMGRVLVWLDRPRSLARAYLNLLRRKGNAYILK